jgi:hypothetical protein
MHVFSQTQLVAWIVALFILEVLHLKWIWLSEWSCGRCHLKNLECACEGRWIKHL